LGHPVQDRHIAAWIVMDDTKKQGSNQ